MQLACPFSELPQPFTAAKSPLVIAAAISVSATSPLLVSVSVSITVCVALAVVSCCAPKLSASGASPSVAGAVPVPRSVAVCVPAESVMRKLPLRVPDAVGTNTIDTVHPPCVARLLPQLFAEIWKSPVTAAAPSAVVVPPRFETVIFCTALVAPIVVGPNTTLSGSSTIAASAVPVPLKLAVACPPATLP